MIRRQLCFTTTNVLLNTWIDDNGVRTMVAICLNAIIVWELTSCGCYSERNFDLWDRVCCMSCLLGITVRYLNVCVCVCVCRQVYSYSVLLLFSGILWINRNKPSTMIWRGVSELLTCSCTPAGQLETTTPLSLRGNARERKKKDSVSWLSEMYSHSSSYDYYYYFHF